MNPILRNILAVITGIIVGSAVNMGLIMISGSIVPPPEGVDMTTMEGIKAGMAIMEPKHFIMPFLAHAFGTLAGAFVCYKIAVGAKMKMAIIIGIFFLVGGITNIKMLPGSPRWFNVLDIVFAYFPMAWLGGIIARK